MHPPARCLAASASAAARGEPLVGSNWRFAVVAMATALGAFAVASDVGFVEAGATLLLSAVAIGCTLLRAAPTLRCVALLCHAILLGFVELHLLAEDSATAGDGGGAYPPWLVAATVGGGLFVVERLHADDGRMAPPPICWWLLLSVHAGRAALLVEPVDYMPQLLSGVAALGLAAPLLVCLMGARRMNPRGRGVLACESERRSLLCSAE